MDNNVYIFLCITLVTSLSTADLTPNFSEYNLFTSTTSGIIQFFINCLDDVLEKLCYNIIQVWYFNLTNIKLLGLVCCPLFNFGEYC